MPKESSPDVSIPIVYISLHQNGISAQDSERLLVKPIEDEVKTVEGVSEVRSTAYSGGGNVLLEFDAGFDSDQAMVDIREKVDRAKGDLPNEADEPTVNEVNISTFPILSISLSGEVPNRTLQDLADILQDDIETIPSVLDAKIGGKRNEQLDILINPTAVESYGINLESLINIVRENNKLVTGTAFISQKKGKKVLSIVGEMPSDFHPGFVSFNTTVATLNGMSIVFVYMNSRGEEGVAKGVLVGNKPSQFTVTYFDINDDNSEPEGQISFERID